VPFCNGLKIRTSPDCLADFLFTFLEAIIVTKIKIAYLEDEANMAALVMEYLDEAGFEATWFQRGLACARAVERGDFNLCLFDWMVPDMNGPDVFASIQLKLKEAAPPVIFLTGKGEDNDIVQVLDAGADDYIVKPVTRPVLLARIRAVLRKRGLGQTAVQTQWGALSIDVNQREIYMAGKRLDLGAREIDLAFFMLQNIGVLLTRERLNQIIFGLNPDIQTRALDVHMSTLRRALDLRPENGWRLATVYGRGYRLERSEEPIQ